MRLSCKFEICKSPKCSPLKCKSKKTVFLQYLDFFSNTELTSVNSL